MHALNTSPLASVRACPFGAIGKQDKWGRIGRLSLPWALFAFPFYLWKRSPGKTGSHYDPECDLFTPGERNQVGSGALRTLKAQ